MDLFYLKRIQVVARQIRSPRLTTFCPKWTMRMTGRARAKGGSDTAFRRTSKMVGGRSGRGWTKMTRMMGVDDGHLCPRPCISTCMYFSSDVLMSHQLNRRFCIAKTQSAHVVPRVRMLTCHTASDGAQDMYHIELPA